MEKLGQVTGLGNELELLVIVKGKQPVPKLCRVRVLVGPLLSWTKGCVFLSRGRLTSQKSKPALSYRSQTVRGPLDRTASHRQRLKNSRLNTLAGESPE